MNRIEFLNSIVRDNNTDMIVEFFDQHMLLYDLLDTVKYISVVDSSHMRISFQLDYEDDTAVPALTQKLSGIGNVIIYNKLMCVSYSEISSRSIIITIQQA